VYDRGGGVLSPVLFSLYIDDLIAHLKSCGYGIHVGSLFVGCVLYADDIVLLSASCQGLQQLINVYVKYGERWDIRFNPFKSHAVTVGGNNPSQLQITLNEKSVGLLWANKVKYLGVYIESNTGLTELSDACRMFYGQFNSIMSVLGKCENEMAAIHLIKSYCSPTLMNGCEV